jgi:putative SOS response-associated peptidase YedK
MCGRYTNSVRRSRLAERFEVAVPEDFREGYNIAPTQPVLNVRRSKTGPGEAAMVRWGLVPHWAKDISGRR